MAHHRRRSVRVPRGLHLASVADAPTQRRADQDHGREIKREAQGWRQASQRCSSQQWRL